MYTQVKISEKDYRMWFMLKNRTRISILTQVGEADNATIINGIGQGSFAAALAVCDITKGEVSDNIGNMPINCLIFQNDFTKINRTMEDARKGAKDIGRMLESKQLNASLSKFVVIGSGKSRIACLKEAETNPLRKGELMLENSASEKYLGDKII